MRGAAASLLLAAGGCYHARPIDERAVLDGLRRMDEARAMPPPGAGGLAGGLDDGLEVDEAVALALKFNPDLRAFRRERDVAEGEVVTASAISNPVVRFELLHVQEADLRRMGWGARLAWTPPQPCEWSAARGRAGARVDEVRHEIAEREWQTATDVRAAHAALVAIDEELGFASAAVAARGRIAELVRKRVAQGASTRIDQNLVDLSRAAAETDRDALEARRVALERTLVALMGVSSPGPLVVKRSPDEAAPAAGVPATLPDARMLEEMALASRGALRAAKARHAEADETARLEHARRWPWFTLSAAPRFQSDVTAEHPRDFSLSVDVTVPILNWNSGPIAAAEAAREREKAGFEASLAAIRRDIAVALGRIAAGQTLLRRYRESVLPALEEHDRLVAAAGAGAQIDVVALLAAEETALRGRRDYAEARLQVTRAWLDLDRAVGAEVSTTQARSVR